MKELKNYDYVAITLYVGDKRVENILICREQLKEQFGLDFDILDTSNMGDVFKYCWKQLEPTFRAEYKKVYGES